MVATGISLNERFTQMQSKQRQQQQQQGRGRSRSRSRSRRIVDNRAGNTSISAANSRLLQEFKRRHTVQTALKLKRVCVPQKSQPKPNKQTRAQSRTFRVRAAVAGWNSEEMELNNPVEIIAPSAWSLDLPPDSQALSLSFWTWTATLSSILNAIKSKIHPQPIASLQRSLRNASGRGPRVGGVKSLRLAPNGKPVRSNNVTRLAT